MRIPRGRIVVSLLFLLLSPTLTAPQTRAPEHPLEGLTAQEYCTVHEVLQATGKVGSETFVMSVLLHEPPKEKVLVWKEGIRLLERLTSFWRGSGW